MKVRRMQDVTKWDKWLASQNEATQVYFKNKMKEDNPIIMMSMFFGFCFGLFVGLLFGI